MFFVGMLSIALSIELSKCENVSINSTDEAHHKCVLYLLGIGTLCGDLNFPLKSKVFLGFCCIGKFLPMCKDMVVGFLLILLVPCVRGLRQGDSLSPYLYLLVAEGMLRLLQAGIEQNQLTGFCCNRTNPNILHLFFSDDSIIFSSATTRDCVAIHGILKVYSKAIKQFVNYAKSSLYVNESVSRVIIGVRRVYCHKHYLGLPSLWGCNKGKLFENIKDHIWGMIKGWRRDYSVKGRYKLGSSMEPTPSTSNGCGARFKRKEIWGMDVALKIKIFL
ncbi:hypothetical protein Dsin_007170 [Dipteronia sinensis]|uniref:Reverse transcriptase domain-containing protein n=1 Tax=Dipteronia sinensis TaxID=43782 RepID=A0AAE0AZL7_9ROSI|nr:hypothetical protein Dsin_007170 [Dipteronia sinensis]